MDTGKTFDRGLLFQFTDSDGGVPQSILALRIGPNPSHLSRDFHPTAYAQRIDS